MSHGTMSTMVSTHVDPVRGRLGGDERGAGEGRSDENDVTGEHVEAR